jgi:hypothetical protein
MLDDGGFIDVMGGIIRLESTGNVVGVLVAAVFFDFTAVEFLVEDFFGVLLGLVGGVWFRMLSEGL